MRTSRNSTKENRNFFSFFRIDNKNKGECTIMTTKKLVSSQNAVAEKATKATKATKAEKEVVVAEKKVEKVVVAEKKVSNTQRCADMIIALAQDAKKTRQEIVASVSDAIKALSVVTVKTMLSDLHNSKYARRYSTTTIKTDRDSKIVSINKSIA